MDAPIGRLGVAVLDCPDARELAAFYRSIIGGQVLAHPDGHWFEVHADDGALAFQQIDDHQRPTWPEGAIPQQGHFDFDVDDLDAREAQVLELGATKADVQPHPDDFRVFIDPAGHPFCLVRPSDELQQVDLDE